MVSMASSEVYRIGSVTYDSSTRTLTHDNGQTEYFTPRVSDVFLLLLAHQGKCVEKEFLLSQCWGDTIVSEQALTNVISKLRKVLANHALDMITITTVSKSGYLLEVKEESLSSEYQQESCDSILEHVSEDMVVEKNNVKIKETQLSFYSNKRFFYFILTIAILLISIFIYTNNKINTLPYFIDTENYSNELSVGSNNIYFNNIDKYKVDKVFFIKDIKKGVSSICESKVFIQFYYNTRIANNTAVVVFIITSDGRTFNFRMSKYINGGFSKQLNDYLKSKKVIC
ncbi:transcriptional regulator [Photobacterium angustum]|uniref:Transcriptional regulator n=2 Tax=Photobacterium angustum TaxID=661 RepID=A0ABX5H274_PHOAN|nr:transcriptional regulator [Photobacterium angustum]